jgi:hypothetical protein
VALNLDTIQAIFDAATGSFPHWYLTPKVVAVLAIRCEPVLPLPDTMRGK